MPLHFPHLGHKEKEKDKASHTTSESSTPPPPVAHRQSTTSSTSTQVSGSNPPSSILKKSTHANSTAPSRSSTTDSRTSTIDSLSQNLSLSHISSDTSSTHHRTGSSSNGSNHHRTGSSSNGSKLTPATSTTSLDALNTCPLPQSAPGARFPFFTMTLSSLGTLSFIAMPVSMRPSVLEAINQAWKRGSGIAKITEIDYAPEAVRRAREEGRCDGGVWEVGLKDTPWSPGSADRVSSKRILINLLTTFAAEGYNLVSSYRTSAKNSSKDTLSFLQGEPDPDPIFMAIAFHSNDRIWIIDAEADVGEAVEEGIRKFWDKGIRDARVRERHCREIRLKGDPWTSHNTNSLISSRIIHLAILKHITHMDRGYDFVGSVDMGDAEEGEMPVTFYRRRWGSQRAIWNEGA